MDALRRLGFSDHFLTLIEYMMKHRTFEVAEASRLSGKHSQKSGIFQGCTLSPLLFICLMTVMMHDAVAMLGEQGKQAYDRGDLADLAYCDDTMIISVSTAHVAEFLAAIASAGERYGMSLHYGKLQAMGINTTASIPTPVGGCVSLEEQLLYLGTTLHADGNASAELSRRIGMAKGDFTVLSKVWRHSNLYIRQKVEFVTALIETKLLYSLVATCLKKSDLRRLDGFQCRCMRQLLKIPPAYISRVFNKTVLQKAGVVSISVKLERRQLLMLGRVLRASHDNPMHVNSFIPGTLRSAADRYVRRVGRPRKEWICTVLENAYRLLQGKVDLMTAVSDEASWRQIVCNAFSTD